MSSSLSNKLVSGTAKPLPSSLSALGSASNSPSYLEPSRLIEKESFDYREGTAPVAKLHRFMAIVRGKNDLGSLLEAIYIAHLLKEQHTHLVTSLLVHTDNRSLAEATGLFNRIYSPGEKLKKIIQAEKVDILYAPSHDNYVQLLSSLSGSHIGITGFGRNILAPYLGLRTLGEARQQDFLKKHGYDLRPKKTLPQIIGKLKLSSPPPWLLHTNNYVWLSLFEENELNQPWPPAYALRLMRLLRKAEFAVLVPVPDLSEVKSKNTAKKIQSALSFLKKNAPNCVQFIEKATPTERAAGMQRALAVCRTLRTRYASMLSFAPPFIGSA